MLDEPFPEALCLNPMTIEDANGVTDKDEIIENQRNLPITAVAEVICRLPPSHEQFTVMPQDVLEKQQNFVSPHKGRVRWTISDTLTLINAKQLEKNVHSVDGVVKRTKSALEKWKQISLQCQKSGLRRNGTQCRDRWEHIIPDYKKIRDYERNTPPGHMSFWNMMAKERMDKKLPTNYSKEIYEAIENYFGQNQSGSPADMIIDTSASDHRPFDECHFPVKNSPPQDNGSLESPFQSVSENSFDRCQQYAGKRPKMVLDTADVVETLIENNKMLVSNLKMAEEGRMKRHERYCSMFERRMEMDEKFLNHHAMNMQRVINVEEQKVKAQRDLVSALNTIGQAMLKICESVDKQV
ncbi:hypothetical protein SUGI_0473210 [Cryptomeria japonica]|uniref:trihelix transcription factor ASR3 isoform X1 n=1 Tax=Cryptomeria japonica TaxID=3369 RepID=UPI002408EA4F|nr:trihelix transcription factor ASR3 isoform X1 [Cryptomeria japonica]XP_057864955.2 trihelix transcription factor ASR3 isoform X1 [Cryptomeria japonica]XP_057864956.2 trihelix transcription factor ASR3 isoform X1 [Cryptomeria japonica]XP_057864957.2 trihelix transcription factor ASR3 isoform X1 [Cryptomeria japonica]XP_057864958.2 trihelix transcription factor ASR3 isoform X1 [Cryptomeria japonica]XP_057864959.2 trihelix transcription factor ASR3 isoform X1 [Cryptomeria japonica]GLJ24755.1 